MDLSVVIPVKNEAGNIAPLLEEIRAALEGIIDYEVLFIDDGSQDDTAAEILALAGIRPRLRLLRHDVRYGQTAAIRPGVRGAGGVWIATLDGDGQNDPADIPDLWRVGHTNSLSERGLIAGYREKRQDVWFKRLASPI